MDFVYMVKCADNTYYTGWTTDPAHRLATHNSGKGAKYTRPRLPVHMVYLEQSPSKSAALSRENAIKKLTRGEKDILISTYNKTTKNHPPFTPICWVSWQANDLTDSPFAWDFDSFISSADTKASVLINMVDYPVKLHKKRKKKTTKKENL